MKQLRIGFLSAADIGKKNWKAIYHSGNCVVSAVASRDEKKSREFVRQCQSECAFAAAPEALGSYEELVASPNVDAIYLPLPTGLRREWAVRAAQNGKHVLCEKPCAASVAELEEMLAACRENGVQFMDGVMYMHNPRLPRIRALLDDGESIGQIQRLSSWFSFCAAADFFERNIRVDPVLEPAGCIGDLSWYSIRFFLWTLDWQMPRAVSARILSQTSAGVPIEVSAEFFFDHGVTAQCYNTFLSALQQQATIGGRKGWLRMTDFVLPHSCYEPAFELNNVEVRVETGMKCPPGGEPVVEGHPSSQETRLWQSFSTQILSGKLNEEWPMWSLKTQTVVDACFESGRTGKTINIFLPRTQGL